MICLVLLELRVFRFILLGNVKRKQKATEKQFQGANLTQLDEGVRELRFECTNTSWKALTAYFQSQEGRFQR